MNSETPSDRSEKNQPSADVGPSTPQYQNTVEKSFTLPEETLARIKAEAARDQTSESEALIKIVAAYQPGV